MYPSLSPYIRHGCGDRFVGTVAKLFLQLVDNNIKHELQFIWKWHYWLLQDSMQVAVAADVETDRITCWGNFSWNLLSHLETRLPKTASSQLHPLCRGKSWSMEFVGLVAVKWPLFFMVIRVYAETGFSTLWLMRGGMKSVEHECWKLKLLKKVHTLTP
jgi:hypothetical protein